MQRCIAVIALAIVFFSCNNKSKTDLAVFGAAVEGLEQSNKTMSYSTEHIYHELAEKLVKPETAERASIWQPRAMVIKEKTTGMINYIEHVISELKKSAGFVLQKNMLVIREDNMDAVSRLFIDKKTGEELYQKLKRYKADILNVDTEINKQFAENAIITTEEFDNDTSKEKDFTQTFFKDIPVIEALSMLSKFENNVRVLENKLVGYCYYKIPTTDGDFFTKFSVIVSQSTNYIKAGDKIEISAGVGAYSTQSKPVVIIDGKTFQSAAIDGIAAYKFKTPLKTGKYLVPVKIEYTDQNGKRQVVTEKVEYTVVE